MRERASVVLFLSGLLLPLIGFALLGSGNLCATSGLERVLSPGTVNACEGGPSTALSLCVVALGLVLLTLSRRVQKHR